MVFQFDPAKLTLSEVTKIQERVTKILGVQATLDQTVLFIKNNEDLVPTILVPSSKDEVCKATKVAPKVDFSPTETWDESKIYPVPSKRGNSLLWGHLPWDLWADGNVRELTFVPGMNHASMQKFRYAADKEAIRRGLKFSAVKKSRYSKTILVQFTSK